MGGIPMEHEVRRFLWVAILIGFLLAVGVGLAADDRGMIVGASAAAVGGAVVTPVVARLWRGPGDGVG